MMPSTECGSCHQEVWFCEKVPAEMNDRGLPKTNPVNADSIGDPKGTVEVWSERIPADGGAQLWALYFRYLKKNEEVTPGRKRAVSHFSTCPEAGQWRSRKPASGRRS